MPRSRPRRVTAHALWQRLANTGQPVSWETLYAQPWGKTAADMYAELGAREPSPVRVVCVCGRRLDQATWGGPLGMSPPWKCERCHTAWEVDLLQLRDVWVARGQPADIRLPLTA